MSVTNLTSIKGERRNKQKCWNEMTTSNLDLSSSESAAGVGVGTTSSAVPSDISSQFHRTPYYCEENVYLLCKTLCTNGTTDVKEDDLFVVFISNEKKQIPLWHQKASQRADGITLWDYHVICVERRKESNGTASYIVWDLDSKLPFPSPLSSYVSETIRPSFQLFAEFQRVFRIVHAPLFLSSFASDRRHMKDSEGNWTYQPPPHQPIVAQDGIVHNLNEYMEISSKDAAKNVGSDLVDAVLSEKLGVLVTESQVEEFFSLLS